MSRIVHFQMGQPVQKRVPFGHQRLKALLMLVEYPSRPAFLSERGPELTLPTCFPSARSGQLGMEAYRLALVLSFQFG